ncbi:hypothetical protein ACFONG_03445 [Uliginosibacterium paludis]|uniref:Leucine-rich repeat domain-containing protein n=1 Tax=Uliginosibacterium paludis TaxID=1615952 RepID=A0ABV2CNV0_9RHOO
MSASYELRDDEHGIGRVLIPRGSWNAECSFRLNIGDVRAVRLSESAGFRDTDLGFLSQFQSLRSVEIYSSAVKDIQPLNFLNMLEVLGLQTNAKTTLGAENFPSLRVALLRWSKGMEALLSAQSLRYLNVVNFPFEDLSSLCKLSGLQRLSLTSRKLKSLAGIGTLTELQHLDLYACPNLRSLQPIAEHAKLTKVEVESCRHIPSQR